MDLSAPTRVPMADTSPPEPQDPPAPGAVRRTLALRLAQRGRLRELRAERLARLRGGAGPSADPSPDPVPAAGPPAPRAAPTPAAAAPIAAGAAGADSPRLTGRKAAEEDAVAALEEFLRALTGGLGDPLFPGTAAAGGIMGGTTPGTTLAEPAAVLPFQRREAAEPERAGRDPAPAPDAEALPGTPAGTPVGPLAETPAGIPAMAPAETPAGTAAETAVERPAEIPAETPAAPGPVARLEQLPGAGPGLIWALGRAGIGSLADLAALEPGTLAERLGPIGRLVPAGRWIAAARAARAADPG